MLALSTLNGGLVRNGRRYWRWTPMVRKLGASATAVALKLKDLAPYAVTALVVPGGALITILLWLYRRQKRRRVFPDSLDTPFGRALYLKNTPRSCDKLRQNGSGRTAKTEGHQVIYIGRIGVDLDGGGADVDRDVRK